MSTRPPALLALSLAIAVTFGSVGCRRTGGAAARIATPPTLGDATDEARCGVRSSASKPLVVEWPGAERAALEARAARGLVAVRYVGCEMEVLTGCTATGDYRYVALTKKQEGVRITDADQLYAQLPVGAAGLEAKLARAGQLNVDMTIVGRKEADTTAIGPADLTGRCQDATHVVTGLTLGAFSFYSGAQAEVGGHAGLGKAGAGAESTSSQALIKADGDQAACDRAGPNDEAPPSGCAAVIRVEVVPLEVATASVPPLTTTESTPQDDPLASMSDEDRTRYRKARFVFGAGLIGMSVVAAPMIGTGTAIYTGTRNGLKDERGEDEVSEDRADQVAKAQAARWAAVAGGGIAAMSLGLLIGGLVRMRRIRNAAATSTWIRPSFGPTQATLGVGGRF